MMVKRGSMFVFCSRRTVDLALQQGCYKRTDQQQGKDDVRFTTRNGQHNQPHAERCVAQGILPKPIGHTQLL